MKTNRISILIKLTASANPSESFEFRIPLKHKQPTPTMLQPTPHNSSPSSMEPPTKLRYSITEWKGKIHLRENPPRNQPSHPSSNHPPRYHPLHREQKKKTQHTRRLQPIIEPTPRGGRARTNCPPVARAALRGPTRRLNKPIEIARKRRCSRPGPPLGIG